MIVFHNVVKLITFETSGELFPVIVLRLAEVFLLCVFFGLLEKLLEFLGDHSHFFLIKIRAILLHDLQSNSSILLGLLFLLRIPPKLIGLKVSNKLIQGDFFDVLGLLDGRDFGFLRMR